MAQEGDAVYYPQEMLDLNWNTTSKEKIQEVYKVWAGHYDRVCFELPKFFGRKQPKFREATSSFPAKWPRRNDCRNAVLMTSQYPADLGSASDWLKQISLPARLIRSSTLALTTSPVSVKFLRLCHRDPQTSFRRGTSGGVANPGGMLVVSLRGVNFGFWSHLGCSGQNAIMKVSFRVARQKIWKYIYCLCFDMVSFRGQKELGPHPDRSPLAV